MALTVSVLAALTTTGLLAWLFRGLETAVTHASGPIGLVVITVYSFLIAFILPLPSEVVLVPVETGLGFGFPPSVDFLLILLVSGVGKAAGSVVAFHLGHEAKQSGPVEGLLRRSRFDVVEWSENKTVQLAQEYGYVGLALALSVPFFPDTLSIYAFTVLEEDYVRFAGATFAGSVGRLLITAGAVGGVLTVL